MIDLELRIRIKVLRALCYSKWVTLDHVERKTGLKKMGDNVAMLALHRLDDEGVVEHDIMLNRYRKSLKFVKLKP